MHLRVHELRTAMRKHGHAFSFLNQLTLSRSHTSGGITLASDVLQGIMHIARAMGSTFLKATRTKNAAFCLRHATRCHSCALVQASECACKSVLPPDKDYYTRTCYNATHFPGFTISRYRGGCSYWLQVIYSMTIRKRGEFNIPLSSSLPMYS